MNKIMKKIVPAFIIVALSFCSLGLFACGGGQAEPLDQVGFAKALKDNPAKAMEDYGKNPVIVTGKVLDITQNSFRMSYYVKNEEVVYGSGAFGTAFLVEADQKEIAKLSEKDVVTVTGKIEKIYADIVSMKATSVEVSNP